MIAGSRGLVVLLLVLVTTGCATQPAIISSGRLSSRSTTSLASNFCDRTHELTAGQQDRLLYFSAIVRDVLETTDGDAVIISRSGIDLSRFRIRYSHAAVALRGQDGIWSVRQLYYACDEGRPRIYDQGVSGFVMGTENASLGYVSVVKLPADVAQALHRVATDRSLALRLLAAHYSANAYAFGLDYQNCNQWLIELLATAWGNLSDSADLRAQAQRWLLQSKYQPASVEAGSWWLMAASTFVPLLHLSDHPKEDQTMMKLRISLPTSIEDFIRQRYPDSQRIEICHNGKQAIIHEGWDSVANGCLPSAMDRVLAIGT